ncbi:hypothetical protein SRHO_G00094480 [Serrasalmus rhombeus]
MSSHKGFVWAVACRLLGFYQIKDLQLFRELCSFKRKGLEALQRHQPHKAAFTIQRDHSRLNASQIHFNQQHNTITNSLQAPLSTLSLSVRQELRSKGLCSTVPEPYSASLWHLCPRL